jgi:hypothetical protein
MYGTTVKIACLYVSLLIWTVSLIAFFDKNVICNVIKISPFIATLTVLYVTYGTFHSSAIVYAVF